MNSNTRWSSSLSMNNAIWVRGSSLSLSRTVRSGRGLLVLFQIVDFDCIGLFLFVQIMSS
ncbi:transmembrane protein, putative [Medicago truncatula]|uniref:Transmembrane protein, putative n=1 Tax=Medicago truncatula TaxID=3880 RepID=G7L9Y6_MEDTR|nr:transmembrane protein, putative [Medicago truncatula]